MFKKIKNVLIGETITRDTDEGVIQVKFETNKHDKAKEEGDKEEFMWVEGYKGTDTNMKCGSYQFKLGEIHKKSEDMQLDGFEFDFCGKLKDIFTYHPVNLRNRFFRVQALVNKSEYLKMKDGYGKPFANYAIVYGDNRRNSLLVAEQVVILDELGYNDIREFMPSEFCFIENEDEYNSIEYYYDFAKGKFLGTMNRLGFSQPYSLVKFDDLKSYVDKYIWLKRAEAYVEEGIGRDMLIYLLEQP